MTHTIGPWVATPYKRNANKFHIGGTNDPWIADVYDGNGDYDVQANARLIAAAPELLDVCKAAFPVLMYRHQHGDCTCLEGKPCPMADMATVIAKAEGR